MRREVSESGTIRGDLADLRALCLVIDHGSITAAARALGETKGSVSRRVSRLEATLGAALLRRGPRSVSATEEGAAFRARVGSALELLDEAAAALSAGRAAPKGLLRVTGPSDLGAVIAPVVAGFIDAHPAVRVEVELTQKTLDFEADRIDVAFRAAAVLRDSSLIAHRLLELSLGLFASPSYLARHGAPASPEELAAHRLVLMRFGGSGAQRLTLRRGELDAPLPTRAALMANDNTFVRDATVAGSGIGLLLELHAAPELALGRLVRVLDGWALSARGGVFLLHAAGLLPEKVRAFRDHALRVLRSSGGRRLVRVR